MAKKSSTKREKKDRGHVVIRRNRWLTGEVAAKLGATSYLYDSKSKMMCCLGFVCRQLGMSQRDIENVPDPEQLLADLNHDDFLHVNNAAKIESLKASGLVRARKEPANTTTCSMLMADNDEETLSREERERKIASGLGRLGYTVEFRGRYPKVLDNV